jgi:hypothetical protein
MSTITKIRDSDKKRVLLLCAAVMIGSFALDLMSITFLSILVNFAACAALTGFYLILLKEFKSGFIRLILIALICIVLGEAVLLVNSGLTKYTTSFWLVILLHFIRNISLSVAYFWNVIKSEIYNEFWIKILPYIIAGITYWILNAWIYANEPNTGIRNTAFIISDCLLILSAGLRPNHTADSSFYLAIIGSAFLILSDVFMIVVWWYFTAGLRSVFIIAGTWGIVESTFDHVTQYKLTVKERIYHQTNLNIPLLEVK